MASPKSAATPLLPPASVEPAKEESLEEKGKFTTEKANRWPFSEADPIREDYVQNAVKFLSHAKVISSPIAHRRSFLERKGLSKEEIDEAFRRVPDASSNMSMEVSPYQEGQSNASRSRVESHSTAVPKNLVLPSDEESFVHHPIEAVPLRIVKPGNSTNWWQIFMAIGLFSAISAGTCAFIMNYLIPKFKTWLREIVLEQEDAHFQKQRQRNTVELVSSQAGAVAAAIALAAAATQVAEANQNMIKSQHEDSQHLSSFTSVLESIIKQLCSTVNDMKSIAIFDYAKDSSNLLAEQTALDAQKTQVNANWHTLRPVENVDEMETIRRDSKSLGVASISPNGVYSDSETVQRTSTPSSTGPGRTPYSASYMEIVAMLERGEKPPGIQEINDKPPNLNQPPSSSRLQPRRKPWQVQSGSDKLNSESPTLGISSSPVTRNTEIFTSATEKSNSNASWLQHKKMNSELHNAANRPTDSTFGSCNLDFSSQLHFNQICIPSQPNNSATSDGMGSKRNVEADPDEGWVPPSIIQTAMLEAASASRYLQAANKSEPKIMPSIDDSSASSLTGQGLSKAPSTDHESLSSASTAEVTLHEDRNEQGTGSLEHVHAESALCEDVLKA